MKYANDMTLERLAKPVLELGPPPREEGRTDASGRRLSLKRGADDVAWALLDRSDSSANSFDQTFFEEFEAMLGALEADPPKALVIRSATPSGFAVGADVHEFKGLTDDDAARLQIEEANTLIDRFEALPFKKIAVFHGACAGGGVELALACDIRLAIAGARLSLPEIKLGLHPGLGGAARLTHLIDPAEAMTLMLTGREVDAAKAKWLGMVDAVVEERHVANAVRAALADKIEQGGGGLRGAALRTAPARRFAASRMRDKADEKARPEHYPAPRRLIALWEEHGGDKPQMLRAERESFVELLTGETAQALFRVFDLRSKLKRFGDGVRHHVGHVHVIGAGAMGGDIAAWCALKGFRVSLTDPDEAALGKAYAAACALFDKELDRAPDRLAARDRLIWDPKAHGVAAADLVIEAAPEDSQVKREIYVGLAPRLKPDAILATNTSSLSLAALAEAAPASERFVGLHFFNPVAKMPLIEVARDGRTAEDAYERTLAFATALGKLPCPVRDAPGFLVNRALTPYMLEALVLMDEGVEKEAVDGAAEAFGMPIGPVQLADEVGLDICLEVAASLRRAHGVQGYPPVPDWLADKVLKGALGRKTGAGLYLWKDGEARKDRDIEPAGKDVQDRLVLPMLNAAVASLREGVVENADLADAGLVFGAGFAPFRGGPIAYARSLGPRAIAARLEALASSLGPRFAPDPGWSALEEKFHA